MAKLVFMLFALLANCRLSLQDADSDGLRWFPAISEQDCNVEATFDGETVREGKPSRSCKDDNERFCFCGQVGKGDKADWRYLCGTCKFTFKLDRARPVNQTSSSFAGSGRRNL
ncbi:uncharacterized protein LOC111715080 [Eurytemora carolleeae]|uniref:uncharacterized protein LOC111715080 n=1 Tax=Eurytemora carolleeae TaxID=1294199 RepID=UPI000C764065|nr:uncharacterized protein LOC111715080 [Eurytemora carolleeae]|eukprot:XP_023346101.1 uncharacterized protein LOC111715080 [Eurytemora affinis]